METNNMQPYIGPKKRLSIIRVFFMVIILIGITYGTAFSFVEWRTTKLEKNYSPWFASYVDVTSTPSYKFEKPESVGFRNVVLSFIVSSPSSPCTPTWGGYYNMDEAAAALDLDRRIARLEQQGGRIAISFGGAQNSELALKCTDQQALKKAYRSVIDRYNINMIDLDLEADGLINPGALERRAQVIAALQKEYRENKKNLVIWLTLPVAPQGLTKDGTNAVAKMLSKGVDLAGINLMTMDYSNSRNENDSMYEASRLAILESHRQLGILFRQAGINLNSASLWKKIGITPMIGQNDIAAEVFNLDDAQSLNQFANAQGVGRMSMWSANRDISCGENYVNVKVVSDLCSGVKAPEHAFTKALSNGFEGDLMQNANMITLADLDSNEQIIDNPAASPYQIWQENAVYLKDTKIVWHGNVYVAKWWTKGDLPDSPVLEAGETPWQLVGPVLPGDKPVKLLTLPSGTFPAWEGEVIYNEGDRVIFAGMPYEAKWWNQGESPAAAAINPDSSPWLLFTQAQISAMRKAMGL